MAARPAHPTVRTRPPLQPGAHLHARGLLRRSVGLEALPRTLRAVHALPHTQTPEGSGGGPAAPQEVTTASHVLLCSPLLQGWGEADPRGAQRLGSVACPPADPLGGAGPGGRGLCR